MQEPPELTTAVRELVQGLEAVNHDKPGMALPEHRRDLPRNTLKPVVAYRRPKILIQHGLADRGPVEEIQALAEAYDLFQRFRDRCEIDCRTARAPVLEGVLLSDNRLAGSGQSHDDADRIRRQPSSEDCIERLVPAQKPIAHGAGSGTGRRNALDPKRSLTVDTSCKGSHGFSKNASAPASTARSLDSSTDTATMSTSLPCSLKKRHRSSPVPPEMRSSTTASDGDLSLKDFRAACSSSVTSTSNPSVFRKYSANSAAYGSPSASRMRSRARGPAGGARGSPASIRSASSR